MKVTNHFKKIIQEHLEGVAANDTLFEVTFKNPNKNIDDCITYILNQVKNSGYNGFASEEILAMAMHYYDERDIMIGSKINCNVVINRVVELTPEEIQKAKQDALDNVIVEEKERLRTKKVKKEQKPKEQISLF